MSVSIVTPVHNSSIFLAETILSVISQTFPDWELILVDDCSTDNSVELAETFVTKESRIRLIRLKQNLGAAGARNVAIEAAKGRYIAFLDSDDLWYPDKLEKQLAFMRERELAFTYSPYEKITETGKVFGVIGAPSKLCYEDLLKTCSIGCLTVVYDTERVGKIYMSTQSGREDFATWLNVLKKINFAYGYNEVLAQYRVYSAQSSAKKWKMAKETWRLYREVEGFGVISSAFYFSNYAVRGFLRARFPWLARLLGVLAQ